MKKSILSLLAILAVSLSIKAQSIFDRSTIKEFMHRTNKYQLDNPWRAYDDNWIRGTYYAGVMACYNATGDKVFLQQTDELCKSLNWKVPTLPPVHSASGANLLTIGQAMIQSYMAKPEKSKIRGVIDHLDNPNFRNPKGNPHQWYYENGTRYVDALFTGPPTLAMLYNLTGDKKYSDWMDAMFWDVYGKLYNTDLNLFYRDKRFFPSKKTKDGKQIIWSRGNGWAIAGIARILEYLPIEHGNYKRYESVLKNMAAALKACQTEEGFWYPNLANPDDAPFKETSGTSFFIYGIAYGINNGILDKNEYLPVVKKAWKSVTDEISKEGKVQWGQLVGDQPVNLSKDDSHEYVTGTFLLAASEMYKMNLNNN
ncbi:glycoside hydrolase family 88 protein [Seonamhaeicola sp.]|uniref:glycoside hydrolase family 88 protein n=1 Tax=Seonamhaeicola sp. TaxID=1912245 RepID=UPI00261F12C9|nr:glycoside hydrolase family 88 protein [Seonamhaeicola sp.]